MISPHYRLGLWFRFSGSENDQILDTIDQVSTAVQNKGIWIIDRGGDRDTLYKPLLKKKRDFVIRLVGSRDLIHKDHQGRALWIAAGCRLRFQKNIVKFIHGKELHFNLSFGFG